MDRPAGVGGILPRIVLEDSVDSVEVVCAVGSGLAKAPSRVGEIVEAGSSLMGDTRRALNVVADAAFPGGFVLVRCCFWIAFSCRLRSRSISSSSGEDCSCSTSSGNSFAAAAGGPLSSSVLSLMSGSVETSSCGWWWCWGGGAGGAAVLVCGDGLLAAWRCSGGRLEGVGVAVSCAAVTFVGSTAWVDFGDDGNGA